MCKQVEIKIYEKLGASTAISTDDGNIIFKQITGIITKGGTVVLDFSGMTLLTSAFLNATVGQLYGKYSSEELQKSLTIANMSADDKTLLIEVIERAKAYFASPEEFEESIAKEL